MYNTTQYTIKKPGQIEGIGVHTGVSVSVTCLPAPPNHGIQFQRMDLPSQPMIPATANYVVATNRGTTLAYETGQVKTVEHLLAAITALQIDNILVQLDGEEVPIMDGSAAPFITLLEEGGLADQHVPRKFFTIDEPIIHEESSGSSFKIFPWDSYALDVALAEDTPLLHAQSANLADITHFATNIAGARTFTFIKDLLPLHEQGLIKGGDCINALLLADKKYTKEELTTLAKKIGKEFTEKDIIQAGSSEGSQLRYSNEPARHKLLDIVGDLALVGRPIKGQIIAYKPGHAANIALAKKLRKMMLRQEAKGAPAYHINQPPIFNAEKIRELLPHRYPFQLVDKVIHLDQESITGIKNVTINEPFFQGHFPSTPVMPGVLQVEAMIQVGGIFILSGVDDPENYLTYFLGIDECKFRKMVVPGDTLVLQCHLATPIKYSETATQIRSFVKVQGRAFVGNQLACQATMFAQSVKEKG